MTLILPTESDTEWIEGCREWLGMEAGEPGPFLVTQVETTNEILVRTRMPGLDLVCDLEMWVVDGQLHVVASHASRFIHRDPHGLRTESRVSEFSREIPLPAGVGADHVRATYIWGTLEIRVPKHS